MDYTFGDMYKLFENLWDKSLSPYLPKTEFDRIATMKYSDFVDKECEKIEKNQAHTNTIHDLYEKFQKLNSDVVIFPTDISNFYYLLRFNGKFKKTCGMQISYFFSNIVKALNGNIDELMVDPFNKPTDEEPLYIADKNLAGLKTYQVFSETIPLELNMTYVREPQKIDSANNPTVPFEIPGNQVAEAIVRAVVTRTDVLIENFPRAQAELGELNTVEGG